MRPLYHQISSQLEFFVKTNTALPPHLHKYLECIYVTKGALRLGIGKKWIDVKPHDLAVIFPGVIHHFQIQEPLPSQAVYLLGAPALTGPFEEILHRYAPASPVIPKDQVHPDISYGIETLLRSKQDPCYLDLLQAYLQIFLARALPACSLTEKKEPDFSDLTWQIISYISEHFAEQVSLTSMARDLCVSPYALSRTFSGTLGANFNQYLNEIRLDHASRLLRTTLNPVTEIFMDCGFSSQTTFNRAFRAKYQLSPREYRQQSQSVTNSQSPLSAAGQEPGCHEGPASDSPWKLATGRFL